MIRNCGLQLENVLAILTSFISFTLRSHDLMLLRFLSFNFWPFHWQSSFLLTLSMFFFFLCTCVFVKCIWGVKIPKTCCCPFHFLCLPSVCISQLSPFSSSLFVATVLYYSSFRPLLSCADKFGSLGWIVLLSYVDFVDLAL